MVQKYYRSIISLLILYLVFSNGTIKAQKHITINGLVLDKDTKEELVGATILTQNINKGTYSDIRGKFLINLKENTENRLTVSYVGYTPSSLNINCSRDTTIVIYLSREYYLKEASISANNEENLIKNSLTGVISLNLKQVKDSPAIFGETDLMKYIQLMPGIQSEGEGKIGMSVRGGDFDQNMIIIDEATIYNPSHMQGFNSAFNVDIIKNVTLYKSSFPAEYGSRLSSIVNINIKNGDYKQHHFHASVGILSAKISANGPIVKNKTSYLISGRTSLYNIITNNFLKMVYEKTEKLNQISNIYFYDANAKISHCFTEKNCLSFNFYIGKDIVGSDGNELKSSNSDSKNRYVKLQENEKNNNWGNMVTSINSHNKINEKLSLKSYITFSRYKYIYSQDSYSKLTTTAKISDISNKTETSISRISKISNIDEISIASNMDYRHSKNHHLKTGFKYSFEKFIPQIDIYRQYILKTIDNQEETTIDSLMGNKHNLHTISLYAEDDLNISSLIKMNLGLRFNLYSVRNRIYPTAEPRINMRFLINNSLSFKGSYSYMSQNILLLSSSNFIMPSDIWVPITDNIKPLTSHQFSIGVYYNLKKIINFSVEGYYKMMNNMIEYREGYSFSNNLEGWESSVAVGKGWSYGLEFLATKIIGRTTGSISYTLSKSQRLFNRHNNIIANGNIFYDKNDCRNNFNINITHLFNRNIDISASFVYKTGARGTLAETVLHALTISYPERNHLCDKDITSLGKLINKKYWWGHYKDASGATRLDKMLRTFSYSERNSYKLPDYHRLDISVNFHKYHKIGQSTFAISVYNIYNNFNTQSVYPGFDEDNKPALIGLCLFPIMPSISYSYKF